MYAIRSLPQICDSFKSFIVGVIDCEGLLFGKHR